MYYFKLFHYSHLVLDTSKIPDGKQYVSEEAAVVAAKIICRALCLNEQWKRIVPLPYKQVEEPRVFTVDQISKWMIEQNQLGFGILGALGNLKEEAIMKANKPKESKSLFEGYTDYVDTSLKEGLTPAGFITWVDSLKFAE